MPRGESPFQGRYTVPQVDFSPIERAGGAWGDAFKSLGKSGAQAIEQFGLNKKQQQTDKATIRTALNTVDVVERNDPNKDEPEVANHYEGMRNFLNDENKPVHGRAVFANKQMEAFSLTSKLKSQQLSQSQAAETLGLSRDLHDLTITSNEQKNRNQALTNQLNKTNLEVTKEQNKFKIFQADLINKLSTGDYTNAGIKELISAGFTADLSKPIEEQEKRKVDIDAARAATGKTIEESMVIAPESEANIAYKMSLVEINDAKAAVTLAKGPQTLDKATANKKALQKAFPDENITFDLKQDDDGDWVTSASFEGKPHEVVGSPAWNTWLDDSIEYIGAQESAQAVDYAGEDHLRPLSNAKHLEFQKRYEQYKGMRAEKKTHAEAKKATGINPNHPHADVEGTVEFVYFEEGSTYRFYLRPMEDLRDSDSEHDNNLYSDLRKLRRNMELRTRTADPELQKALNPPSKAAQNIQ